MKNLKTYLDILCFNVEITPFENSEDDPKSPEIMYLAVLEPRKAEMCDVNLASNYYIKDLKTVYAIGNTESEALLKGVCDLPKWIRVFF